MFWGRCKVKEAMQNVWTLASVFVLPPATHVSSGHLHRTWRCSSKLCFFPICFNNISSRNCLDRQGADSSPHPQREVLSILGGGSSVAVVQCQQGDLRQLFRQQAFYNWGTNVRILQAFVCHRSDWLQLCTFFARLSCCWLWVCLRHMQKIQVASKFFDFILKLSASMSLNYFYPLWANGFCFKANVVDFFMLLLQMTTQMGKVQGRQVSLPSWWCHSMTWLARVL